VCAKSHNVPDSRSGREQTAAGGDRPQTAIQERRLRRFFFDAL
jgi:hypothetical protein